MPDRTKFAHYGPVGIQNFVDSLDHPPLPSEIFLHRANARRDIRKDGDDDLNLRLHPHFLTNAQQRNNAFGEGVWDLQDAVSPYLSLLS